MVSHEEIGQHVWQSQFVSNAMIKTAIGRLRAKIGDNDKGESFIHSHRRLGYSFSSLPAPKMSADNYTQDP